MQEWLETMRALWAGLPGWVQAGPVLFGGILFAWVVRVAVGVAGTLLLLDRLGERFGVNDFLRKGNVLYGPSRLLGQAAYWVIVCWTLVVVAKLFDIELATNLAERVAAMVPEFAAAVLLSVIGFVVVGFFSNVVSTLVRNAGYAHADFAGRCVRWGGVLLVAGIAVDQLGFAKTLLGPIFHIAFAALALSLALAFGLGCKDIARDFAQNFLRELRERSRAGAKSDLEG